MKPSEKNLDHLRPLADAVALEVRAAVETIGPALEHATQEGMRTYGARVIPLLGNSITSTTPPPPQVVYAGPCRLMGWSLCATNVGDGGDLAIFDGVDADGDLLMFTVGISNYGGVNTWFGPSGIALTKGLYVAPLAGGLNTPPIVGSFFVYSAGDGR